LALRHNRAVFSEALRRETISDLFGTAGPRLAVKPLTVFRADLIGSEEASWEELFAGYTPYALREGLYERGWKNYLDVLQRFWQPYLDGRATFSDAIARMVSSL
jgi:hypothetical protein